MQPIQFIANRLLSDVGSVTIRHLHSGVASMGTKSAARASATVAGSCSSRAGRDVLGLLLLMLAVAVEIREISTQS